MARRGRTLEELGLAEGGAPIEGEAPAQGPVQRVASTRRCGFPWAGEGEPAVAEASNRLPPAAAPPPPPPSGAMAALMARLRPAGAPAPLPVPETHTPASVAPVAAAAQEEPSELERQLRASLERKRPGTIQPVLEDPAPIPPPPRKKTLLPSTPCSRLGCSCRKDLHDPQDGCMGTCAGCPSFLTPEARQEQDRAAAEDPLVEVMDLPTLPALRPPPQDPQPEEEEPGGDDALPFPQGLYSHISGQAGTGKTYLLRQRPASEELVATTGIAAINLGGATINSLLGYFDTKSLKDSYVAGFAQARLRGLHEQGCRRVNLDELSMLGGDALDVIVDIFDEVNEGLQQARRPPIGLTLCGDFAQLPPVKAPFAFEARCWSRFEENRLQLTKIHRQADRDFVEALQAVRRGDSRRALEFFSGRFVERLDDDFRGSTVKSKNDEVDRYNALRLRELPGDPLVVQNLKAGVQSGDWKHIPEELELKKGALVMVLANRRTKGSPVGCYDYVNGDLGILEAVFGQAGQHVARVKLVRDGSLVTVDRCRRVKREGTGEDAKELGSVDYLPLRLAWATTAHKSQGLSLDRVQVDIRGHFFTSPGMLYVALSRARTAEGLRLVGNEKLFAARCTVNKKVMPWL